MKLKIWLILIAFVLVLSISSTGLYAQKFRGPGVKWLLEVVPTEKQYTMEKLTEIFYRRNLQLSLYFEENQFDKIGEYFGPVGWIKTDTNDIIIGKTSIGNYFAKLKEQHKVAFVIFRSVEVNIEVDKKLYYSPSNNADNDPVYSIAENIKIIFDMPGKSPLQLTSSALYNHSRPTFRNGE